MLDQPETVEVDAVVEFTATIVASDGFLDRLDPVDHRETVRAYISVIALHPPPFEGQVVIRLFAGNAEIDAGCAPLGSVGVNLATAAPFVSDEVGEFVFQSPPEFLGFTFLEFGVELDGAARPPGPTGRGLHP